MTHSGAMIDPKLTDLIVCAIDYGACLGRLSSDVEPTDLVQAESALVQARARFRAARQQMGLVEELCKDCPGGCAGS